MERGAIASALRAAALLCAAAVPGIGAIAPQSSQGTLKPFTVADSIGMTHFGVPSEGAPNTPPVSPNGGKFFVVIEKGILDKNLREYSLLVYDRSQLDRKPLLAGRFNSSSNRKGLSQVKWLDDETISFLGEIPGGKPQLYLADARSGHQRKLTDDPYGIWSYAISKDRSKVAYYPLWGAEQAGDKYKENHGFAVTDELLQDLVAGRWKRHELVSRLQVRDLSSGRVRIFPPQKFGTRFVSIWLSPDARYAITEQTATFVPPAWIDYDDQYVKANVQERLSHPIGEFRSIRPLETVLVDIEGGKIRPLIDAPSSIGSVTSVVWSSDSRTAVVTATLLPLNILDEHELARRRAHPVVASVNIASGTVQRIIDIPFDTWLELAPGSNPDTFLLTGWKHAAGGDLTGKIMARSFHHEANAWIEDKVLAQKTDAPEIALREAIDHWPVLVRVDRQTQRETVILDPNPQFRHFRFGHREIINWTGKLGEPLTGGLVYPSQYKPGERYPLVIQTHGFSPLEFLLDGSFTTAMAAEELANKGIAVLQLPQSAMEKANLCNRGPATQSQFESAIDYLDSKGLIDRDRVGLVGFSMTGFNVRNALVNSNYHFAAATSAEGNDWGYWEYILWGNWDEFAAQNECAYGGPPWNNNWGPWFKKSISFHYDKMHTPLRLESDSNEQSEVINEWENFVALKRLHKAVELIFISDGDHPVVKPWDRLTSQQGNVDWMTFWLKGEEDPDPAKAEQYARWHELRALQQADDKQLAGNKASN